MSQAKAANLLFGRLVSMKQDSTTLSKLLSITTPSQMLNIKVIDAIKHFTSNKTHKNVLV